MEKKMKIKCTLRLDRGYASATMPLCWPDFPYDMDGSVAANLGAKFFSGNHARVR